MIARERFRLRIAYRRVLWTFLRAAAANERVVPLGDAPLSDDVAILTVTFDARDADALHAAVGTADETDTVAPQPVA
jgi:hypothetical protein